MNKTPLVSICIPTYEMHGKGVLFLNHLLTSIYYQSYKNIEVIISDHSRTDVIKNAVDNCSYKEMEIAYVRCDRKVGNSSANMNCAVENASGSILKIMHQDDFFCNSKAIENVVNAFNRNPNSMWGSMRFKHTREENDHPSTFHNELLPVYNDQIISGDNKIGPPSAMFFKRFDGEVFDEELIWINDCEFAYRMYNRFGPPLVIDEIGVCIRVWSSQVTNTMADKKLREKEYTYIENKYNITMPR